MCGRYNEKKVALSLEKDYGVRIDIDSYKERYNATPGAFRSVIANDDPQALVSAYWSLFPGGKRPVSCSRHESILQAFNPVADKTSVHHTYKRLIRSNRCLVPMAGYFEWTVTKPKIPFYITLKSQDYFFVAGIWRPEKEKGKCFSILTVDPHPFMKQVHDRMPVILPREEAFSWLYDMTEEEALQYFVPYDQQDIQIWQVSNRMNSGDYEAEDVIEPVEEGLRFDGAEPIDTPRLTLFD